MRVLRAAAWLLAVHLCLGIWYNPAVAQSGLPVWLGKAMQSASSSRTGAAINPFQLLGSLSKLPPQEQRILLALVGQTLKDKTGMQCNIFGGAPACLPIPTDAPVADLCRSHITADTKVDCIASLGLNETENSVAEMERSLDRLQLRELQETCPQCLSNLRATVCGQKLPPCGAFDDVVTAVLPALQQVSDALGRGKAAGEALSSAMPQLVDRMALVLPCREQCEATVDSCSCADHELTFGELLEQALTARGRKSPAVLQQGLFSKLHDRRLCDLFAPKNATGFSGVCEDLPRKCTQEKKWCSKDSSHTVVEQQLAVHLAETLFGFAGSLNAGAVDTVVSTATLPEPEIAELEKKYVADNAMVVDGRGGRRGGGAFWRGALAALVTIAAVAALGGLAWVATARWRQEHLTTWAGGAAGYQPMMPADEGQPL